MRLTVWSLAQHMRDQLGASSDAKLCIHAGQAVFNGARRYAHMACDFGVSPSAAGEHGHGELRGGEVVGHILALIGVVNTSPAVAEAIGDLDDARKIIGILRFQA